MTILTVRLPCITWKLAMKSTTLSSAPPWGRLPARVNCRDRFHAHLAAWDSRRTSFISRLHRADLTIDPSSELFPVPTKIDQSLFDLKIVPFLISTTLWVPSTRFPCFVCGFLKVNDDHNNFRPSADCYDVQMSSRHRRTTNVRADRSSSCHLRMWVRLGVPSALISPSSFA